MLAKKTFGTIWALSIITYLVLPWLIPISFISRYKTYEIDNPESVYVYNVKFNELSNDYHLGLEHLPATPHEDREERLILDCRHRGGLGPLWYVFGVLPILGLGALSACIVDRTNELCSRIRKRYATT